MVQRTTVGVSQGCLLSPTLFNIFLKRIISDALEEHDGKVSIGSRNITNLLFVDDIDAQSQKEQELESLDSCFKHTCILLMVVFSHLSQKIIITSSLTIIAAPLSLHVHIIVKKKEKNK